MASKPRALSFRMLFLQINQFCWYFARSHLGRFRPDPRAFFEPFPNQANIAGKAAGRATTAARRLTSAGASDLAIRFPSQTTAS